MRYVIEYPEDIEMFGFSMNTNVGDFSIAMEYAYRPDMPLQIAPIDLTYFAQGRAFEEQRCLTAASLTEQYRYQPYQVFDTNNCPEYPLRAGELIQGYERFPVGQGNVVVLSLADTNPFGADQWVRILDVGFTKVFGMPDISELPLNGAISQTNALPGRADVDQDFDGNFDVPAFEGQSAFDQRTASLVLNVEREDDDAFASAFSWGHRFINILTYEQVLGGTLQLTLAVFHDVNGNTPGPANNFIEGRKTFIAAPTLSLGSYSLGATYVAQSGAGRKNSRRDKDTLAFTLGFTF